MSFQQKLAVGKIGESLIARYLQGLGHAVMPVYEKEIDEGKGPQLFHAGGELVLPDILVLGGTLSKICFAEAKHKTVFSWHYKTGKWTTGIDRRHFEHYLEVEGVTGVPVHLYFLHRQSEPWAADLKRGCPPECPTGLFGERISVLRDNVSHYAPPKSGTAANAGHGTSGMVYWAEETLGFIAPLGEVLAAAPPARWQRPA